MRKNLLKLFAVFLAISLSACGMLPDKIDETASWPAGKLYREAKEEMRGGNYEKAIEYYEKLESRYPFGVFAQQAQIDIAYAYYRDNEPAQALAAVERFIKLHIFDWNRHTGPLTSGFDFRGRRTVSFPGTAT